MFRAVAAAREYYGGGEAAVALALVHTGCTKKNGLLHADVEDYTDLNKKGLSARIWLILSGGFHVYELLLVWQILNLKCLF